jgi:predicted secreted protein
MATIWVVLWVLGPAAAQAQADEPTATGSVAGELTKGGRATFHVTGTHPEGWQALRTAAVLLELRGVVLEEIVYEVDSTSIDVSGSRAVAGTGNVATGRFFRVGAFGVEAATGGNQLRLTVPTTVLEPPPQGARFRFAVESDEGDEAITTVPAAVEEDEGGLSIIYVIGAVIAALVTGGFLGSRVTTRRKSGRSVYSTVARRLDESERPPPGRDQR